MNFLQVSSQQFNSSRQSGDAGDKALENLKF